MGRINGADNGSPCALQEECKKHIELTARVADTVDDSAQTLLNVVENLSYLKQLDFLVQAINRQTDILFNLKTELIYTLTSMITGVAQSTEKALSNQSDRIEKKHVFVYKALSVIIVGLVVMLIFAVTGNNLGWVGP